jgi:hypothetical protein
MARLLLLFVPMILVVNGLLNGEVNVGTNHYGQATGTNLSETTLTADNVNITQFGRLYAYPVDGSVFAQPLYVAGVAINGARRNVLYVATMNDKVYAFDADSPSLTPFWVRDFTSPPSVTAIPVGDTVAGDVNGAANVGIQSTPVIDSASGTLYLVARTKENGSHVQQLHALDIRTGRSRAGSPVRITGSVAGTAPDSTLSPSGRVVTFDPRIQAQVTGLALSRGVVLIAWTSLDAAMSGHGWIMGYDASSLVRVGIFCVTPDAHGGGIGQSGRAPTIDAAGNAYFATAKGGWDGTRNFGDSMLKFSISRRGIRLVDYFTPSRAAANLDDDDLSGAGVTLLPDTNLLLGGGKDGVLYLLHSTNLGRLAQNDTQIVQRVPLVSGGVMGGSVFWDSPTLGPLVYHWSNDDVLKAYRLTGGRLAVHAQARGDGLALPPSAPGGGLTLSANGSTTGTGIIWASTRGTEAGMQGTGANILRAYDAETLKELWASEPHPTRDYAGTLIPFVQPVVANGKVYLATDDGSVVVYGLRSAVTPPVTLGVPTRSGTSSDAISASAASGTIGINFVGSHSTPMGAGDTAGVIAKPNWNNATGAVGGTALALMDESGAPTTARVTWSSAGTWLTPIADSAGNRRLMKGYLNTTDTSTTTVTVTGLPVRPYDVYVYADGDNAATRTAAYRISGSGIVETTVNLTDPAGTNFSETFTGAGGSSGNYVKFSIQASGFTVTASPVTSTDAKRRAPLNGIQIVPAPDLTVTGAIGVNFVGSHSTPMGPGDTAGVIAKPNWNNATGAVGGTALALMDESGAPTTARVTWSSAGTWLTPIADSAGNRRLMKGYLNTTDTSTTTVTVTGLPVRPYDVYVYADGDNAATRTAAYRISGSGIVETTVNLTDPAGTNFSETFTEAAGTSGNYVKFSIQASGFTLTASPVTSTDTKRRAPVNGIQIVPSSQAPPGPPVSLDSPITVEGLGAGQGVEVRDGHVYLYGDASTGVVREYDVVDNSTLRFTGRHIQLTAGGADLVPHPTGLTVAPGLPTLLGNTVSERGTILLIDWARALASATLDGAVEATVADDLAVNGTRPEYVRVGQRWLVATADYGARANEVRLYDPEVLKKAARTSEPGVLVYRFRSSPYVQTLHWLDDPGLLVLVQNTQDGNGWRLTVVDLARSIETGVEQVTLTTDLAPSSELEGFHLLAPGRGLFLTSGPVFNVYFAKVRLF